MLFSHPAQLRLESSQSPVKVRGRFFFGLPEYRLTVGDILAKVCNQGDNTKYLPVSSF